MKSAVFDKLMHAVVTAISVGLIATVFLGVYNVVARYVFGAALLWADEAAVFFMIVMTYVGAVVCAYREVDIRMTIFIDILPPKGQLLLKLVQEIAVAAILYWVTWLSWDYVSRLLRIGMTSDALRISLWTVHSAILVSMAGMALIASVRFLVGIMELGRQGRKLGEGTEI